MKEINWGIIGLGNIARSFANDFKYTKGGRLLGAASRSLEKSQRFCAEYEIPKAYGSYTELINDKEIDALYIATPHNLHFELSLQAIRAGKAILCEKPITTSENDLLILQKEAQSHKTYLMEAMWTYFLPPILKVQKWIQEGRIGNLKYIRADFAFKAEYNPESRLFSPELAGGALLDIGIYPIALSLLLTGSEPDGMHVFSTKAGTGVDMEETMVFEYTDGIKANLYASLENRSPFDALIVGTEGYIKIPDFFKSKECALFKEESLIEKYTDDRKSIGYNYEIDAVHQDLQIGAIESTIMPLGTSLQLQRIMEEVRSKF